MFLRRELLGLFGIGLLLCQLVINPAPLLAQEFSFPAQAETNTNAGLQDLIASVSADNIIGSIAGLTQFSRCLNSPTHNSGTNYIIDHLKALKLTPLVQAFSTNTNGVRTNQVQNIIVRFPGTNPRNAHVLTAHYDSSPNRIFPPLCDANAPGANDNGSGVGVLLEEARLLASGKIRFNDDIILAFFDGEEFGYLGSYYFVNAFDEARDINPNKLPFGSVINMDMVGYATQKGNGKVWAVAQPGASQLLAQQGQALVAKYAPAVRYNSYTIGDLYPAARDPNRLSDQQAFWNSGRGTTIMLTEDVADAAGADPRYHTPGDVLYNADGSLRLDAALMQDTARAALAIIGSKAGPLPLRYFPNLNSLFEKNWSRADRLVLANSESGQSAGRSWLWGPGPNRVADEPYEDASNNTRQVVYFDKARMELRQPGDYITNGLLVKELATGALQMGDNTFVERSPSLVPVAGDPNQQGQNSAAPTYASFKALVEQGAVAQALNQPLTAILDKSGSVKLDSRLSSYARTAMFISNTGHNVPDVFWNWFQTQGQVYDAASDTYVSDKVFNWLDTVGYPICEAYWVKTKVAGKEQDVLVQLFERRVLTFNPVNPAAFQVEMGNVGQHYYSWRYGGN